MRSTRLTGFVIAMVLGPLAAASADDCRLKIDFEELKAELTPCGEGLELAVKYEVEFDNTRPGDQFVILLRVSECGRALTDEQGQPLTFVVPLNCPEKCKGDDRDYEGRFRTSIPSGAVSCPDKVYVDGVVAYAGDDAPLACRDTRAKFRGCYAAPVVVAEPVLVAPQPVYVEPAPVVVAAPPVVVARPVIVAPRPVYVHRPPVVVYRHGPVVRHHRYAVHRRW